MQLVLFSFKFLFVGRYLQDNLTLCGICFSVEKQGLFLCLSPGFSTSSLSASSTPEPCVIPYRVDQRQVCDTLLIRPEALPDLLGRGRSYPPLLKIGQTHWLRSLQSPSVSADWGLICILSSLVRPVPCQSSITSHRSPLREELGGGGEFGFGFKSFGLIRQSAALSASHLSFLKQCSMGLCFIAVYHLA